jgi:dynein heavy chain
MICLIMLFSERFIQAKVIAKQTTVLYKLAKGLSQQHRYDLGLPVLKSVLVMAEELRRNAPDLDEELILMLVFSDVNLPKHYAELLSRLC